MGWLTWGNGMLHSVYSSLTRPYMRLPLLLLFCCALLLPGPGAHAVVVLAADVPPYVIRSNQGAPSGMAIEVLEEAARRPAESHLRQPLVMGLALHPYIVGQPYRLRHLRRALQHLCAARDRGEVWFTTPGAICEHVNSLALNDPSSFA